MFSILKNQVKVADIVNESLVSFFIIITEVAKNNSETVVTQDRIITWHAETSPLSTTALEEILLDLHYHLASSMANPKIDSMAIYF